MYGAFVNLPSGAWVPLGTLFAIAVPMGTVGRKYWMGRHVAAMRQRDVERKRSIAADRFLFGTPAIPADPDTNEPEVARIPGAIELFPQVQADARAAREGVEKLLVAQGITE